MTNPGFQKIVFHAPLHQAIPRRTPRNALILFNRFRIHLRQCGQICLFQKHLIRQCLGIIALKPITCEFIRFYRFRNIADFKLQQFSKILLVRGGPAEVSFERVVSNGLLEDLRGGRGVIFFVGLVGFDKGVGGIVGLVNLCLDIGGFFKSLASFSTCFFLSA